MMHYVKDGINHCYMWERVRDGLNDLERDLTNASLNVTRQRDDKWDWRPTVEQTDALITRLNLSSQVCRDLARAVDRDLRDREFMPDRDALLALADEMDADASRGDTGTLWTGGCQELVRDYAARIRETCGEVSR